jgi:hypothetical protein
VEAVLLADNGMQGAILMHSVIHGCTRRVAGGQQTRSPRDSPGGFGRGGGQGRLMAAPVANRAAGSATVGGPPRRSGPARRSPRRGAGRGWPAPMRVRRSARRGTAARLLRRVSPPGLCDAAKLYGSTLLAPITGRRARAIAARRTDLRLHLGSGPDRLSEWVNIDLVGMSSDLAWDLRRRLPFPDGSARAAFLEHVIEHFALADALAVLKDCHRVLAAGGTIRVGVPDFGRYVRTGAIVLRNVSMTSLPSNGCRGRRCAHATSARDRECILSSGAVARLVRAPMTTGGQTARQRVRTPPLTAARVIGCLPARPVVTGVGDHRKPGKMIIELRGQRSARFGSS